MTEILSFLALVAIIPGGTFLAIGVDSLQRKYKFYKLYKANFSTKPKNSS